jgi:hypothetical protein
MLREIQVYRRTRFERSNILPPWRIAGKHGRQEIRRVCPGVEDPAVVADGLKIEILPLILVLARLRLLLLHLPLQRTPSLFLSDRVVPIHFAHHCPHWNLDKNVFTTFTTLAFSLTILAPGCPDYPTPSKLVQTGEPFNGLNIDTAATAAITAVWRPFRDILLPLKRDTTVPTVAGINRRAASVLKDEPGVVFG